MQKIRHRRLGWGAFVLFSGTIGTVWLIPDTASARRTHSQDAATPDAGSPQSNAASAPAPAAPASQKAAPAEDAEENAPRLTLDFDNQVGSEYEVVRANYDLNGRPLPAPADASSNRVWDGLLTPGENTLEVTLKFKMSHPPLPYLADQVFATTESAKFTATKGLTAIHAVAFAKSDLTTTTEKRVSLELRVAGPDTSCRSKALEGVSMTRVVEALKAAACVLLLSSPVLAEVSPDTGPAGPRALRTMITQRLDSDLAYYRNLVALKGKTGDLGGAASVNFDQEEKRAETVLPLLEAYAAEKDKLGKGHYIAVPQKVPGTHAYSNLLLLLDLAAASEAQDDKSVLAFGRKVATTPHDLPEATRGAALDPAKVYRELYVAMAFANYNEGNDDEAVKWFEHLGPDGDIAKLRGRLDAAAKAANAKQVRLDALHSKPIAVVPFTTEDRPSVKWMRTGLPDVVTSDIVKFSDVPVVERGQLDSVMSEAKLAQMGLTDSADLAALGKLSQAGTLLVGAVTINKADCTLRISVHLVDAETTQLLGLANGKATPEKAVDVVRQLAIDVLSSVGFIDPAAEAVARTTKAPSVESVRDLEQARLLMATKGDEAKVLYAKAMREDPNYARQFKDLQAEFKDISSKVAVMPFANSSGNPADVWMVKGVSEALESDLPKMHFAVVEREQLRAVLEQISIGQTIDPGDARALGKKVNADFTVVGSILHQKPNLRVDARFVDIRTGAVMFAATAENHNDDLLALLVDLDKEVARQLNERLSSDTIENLAAKKMNPNDFEKFVRQELAKDTLAKNSKPPPPVHVDGALWAGIVATAAGVAAGATGFLVSNQREDSATQFAAAAATAREGPDKASYTSTADQYYGKAANWSVAGYVGVGLAAAGIITLIVDQVVNAHPAQSNEASTAEAKNAAH